MKWMLGKRWALPFALLAVVVAGLAFTACGGDEEAEEAPPAVETAPPADTGAPAGGGETEAAGGAGQPVSIAFFTLATANSYNQAEIEGAEAAASELGATIDKIFDGKFNAEEQFKQLQDATASGQYDAFVLLANDGNVVAPAVEEAIAQGIKVVAVYTPIGPDIDTLDQQIDGLVGTVANPITGNGEGLARATVDACEGIDPCKVVYVGGGFTIPFEVKKFDAFKAVIAEHDNIELVGQGEAGFLREEGYKVAQDLLQAHPDINVYTTSGDQMTFGAEQAMQDAGVTGVQLVGNGASEEAIAAVCEGRWHSSFVYLPYTEAHIGTELAVKAVRGEVTEYQAVPAIEESPVGEFVTQENCEQFEPEWKVG